MSEKSALESPDADLQGWYYRNKTSEAERVRLSIVDRSLLLHTLSGRLIARWSLDRLENREVPLLGESWAVGDRALADADLVLESDRDYSELCKASPRLRSKRARFWHQLGFAITESGNQRGAPVFWLLLIGVGSVVVWLFRQLSQL